MVERVAVVGNCQAWAAAKSLQAMAAKASVEHFFLNRVNTLEVQNQIVESLANFDVILSHELTRPRLGPLRTVELRQRYPHLIVFPQIVFSGFHPDVFVMMDGPKLAASPIESCHSLIVAAAFVHGVPAERTPALFNAYVFARLGYFEEFPKMRVLFLQAAKRLGYDLTQDIEDWMRDGAFMHSPNHPTVQAITGTVAKAARKAGVPIRPPAGPIRDLLAKGLILPVFPEIARRIGVPGRSTFKRNGIGGGDGAEVSLEDFVRQSYALYKDLPPAAFDNPRLEEAVKVLREEVLLN